MKKIVIIFSILLVFVMSACSSKQIVENDTISNSESANIENDEISKKKIDGVDYRDIIVSLCKNEQKYDYLLSNECREKVKEGIIDLKDAIEVEYVETSNDISYDNKYITQVVVTKKLTEEQMKDEEVDGFCNNIYYYLVEIEKENGVINDIRILHNKTIEAGYRNGYLDEPPKKAVFFDDKKDALRILDGYEQNNIFIALTNNFKEKYPEVSKRGVFKDNNYSCGAGVPSKEYYEELHGGDYVDEENNKRINPRIYDYKTELNQFFYRTLFENKTNYYRITTKIVDRYLDDLVIEFLFTDYVNNVRLIDIFSEDPVYTPYYHKPKQINETNSSIENENIRIIKALNANIINNEIRDELEIKGPFSLMSDFMDRLFIQEKCYNNTEIKEDIENTITYYIPDCIVKFCLHDLDADNQLELLIYRITKNENNISKLNLQIIDYDGYYIVGSDVVELSNDDTMSLNDLIINNVIDKKNSILYYEEVKDNKFVLNNAVRNIKRFKYNEFELKEVLDFEENNDVLIQDELPVLKIQRFIDNERKELVTSIE